MDQVQSIPNPIREKGKHLTFENRLIIQTRLRDKWSIRRIARERNCSPNTVCNELERGKVLLYNGRKTGYRATIGQDTYDAARKNCGRHYRAVEYAAFLKHVERMFYTKGWSLDACCGEALLSHKFSREEMVCTKTLYNYVTFGLLGVLKSIDLLLRVKRKNKKHKTRERKKNFGRSIEERDASVDDRQEFGHWECDLVLGRRSNDEVRLTLIERKTRCSLIRKLQNKESASVMEAFRVIRDEWFADCFDKVFRAITTDNGSEFARLAELEEGSSLRVYYARP